MKATWTTFICAKVVSQQIKRAWGTTSPYTQFVFHFLIISNLWKSDFFQSHSFDQLTKQTRNCQIIFLQWTLVKREWARAVYPRPFSNVGIYFSSFDFICYLYFTWVNNKPQWRVMHVGIARSEEIYLHLL